MAGSRAFKTWCPDCFKALSTKVRAGIIMVLSDQKEHSVMEIVRRFELKQPTISYHLATLTKVGLLKSRPAGRHVYYQLNDQCPYDSRRCILK